MVLAALQLVGCSRNKPPPPSLESMALSRAMIGEVYERAGMPYTLPYRLFVPLGYDARKRYPLLVYLHGGGEGGADNLRPLSSHVASMISQRIQGIEPFFLLVPQCHENDQWVNRHDVPPYRNYDQSRVAESPASQMVFDVIERLKNRYSLDPARLYITGSSMGGSGTWDLMTRHPGVFAAGIPGTGVNDPNRASALKGTYIWAFHGDQDEVSPVANTRVMVQRLQSLGVEVRYSELRNVGHNSAAFVYYDPEVFRWLLAQRKH